MKSTLERGTGHFLGTAQSPQGGRIASFDMLKDEIVVWETPGGKVIRVFPIAPKIEPRKGSSGGTSREKIDVRCLAFRDEDELYAVTGEGLWRMRIDKPGVETAVGLPVGSFLRVMTGDLLVPEDAVMTLCFSADGRMAAAGTGGRQVIVYDAGTWKEMVRLSGHSRGITGVSFSRDGKRLASSSGRYFRLGAVEANDRAGEVIVWDTTTWQDCLRLAHPDASEFAGVAFDEEGRTLFAAANPVTVSPGKLPRGEIVRWVSRAGMAGTAAGPVALRATAPSTEPPRSRVSRPAELPRAPAAKVSVSRETKPLEGAEFRRPATSWAHPVSADSRRWQFIRPAS